MRDFREIRVWEKAHSLTLKIYAATESFPREETYELTQLRQASASIPANRAGGFGRGSNPELAGFLQIAMGSASEVEYHILLASDLNLLSKKIYEDLNGRTVEVKRCLHLSW